jgi:predicted metal-dependent hydrolase
MLGNFSLFRKKAKPKKARAVKSSFYQKHQPQARLFINERVDFWAPICEVSINRVAIRNQRRRWGSCSSLGNLNFNYKLLFLPKCLADYVVVHELCHLKQLNHSQLFWQEVGNYYPHYKEAEFGIKQLEKITRMNHLAIIEYTSSHTCSYCEHKSESEEV